MDFDWRSIAGAVAPIAPKLGAVLGTAIAGPFGSVIGGYAGSAIAAALGVEETPAAVGKAIAEDPNAAQKIQAVEAERGQEILAKAQVEIKRIEQETEQRRIAADDTDRARQFQLKLIDTGSPLSWGASILATVFTVAFFVLFAIVITSDLKENGVIMAFVGTLTAGMLQILSYFFGSSVGSKDKDARFANLAELSLSKPNPSAGTVEMVKAAAKGGKK